MAQPPYQQPPTASGGSGLDTKTASTLCYVLGWVTGIVFLLIDKDNQEVRFHAWQSIAVFGGLSILSFVIGFIPFIRFFGFLIPLLGFILWLILVIQTYQGKRVVLPIVGPFAEQQAAKS